MTGATGVQMLVHNADDDRWLLADPCGHGMIPLTEADRRRLIPRSVIRYAERTRQPLVVDATRDDRFARDPYFAHVDRCSMMAVPVPHRGELRAILLLENRLIRGAFSTKRLDPVLFIAGQLAVSLDNAILHASLERKVTERTTQSAHATDLLKLANQRLEQLSATDPLTAVANRRRLDDVLATEWQRGQRSETPLAVAMIDIDHFKLYNDHYGHTAGDRCLQRVAHQLGATVRTTDLVARYGGEEFTIFMPDTDTTAGLRSAKRLRTAIPELAEPHTPTTTGIVTVSIGVAATVPTPDSNPDALLELADAELHQAKRSGRNQVRAAPHRVPP